MYKRQVNNLLVPSLCIEYASSVINVHGAKDVWGTYDSTTARLQVSTYNPFNSAPRRLHDKQSALLHELCHANQHYYTLIKMETRSPWHTTPAGQAFIDAVGYRPIADLAGHYAAGFISNEDIAKIRSRGVSVSEWYLPLNSPFRAMYDGVCLLYTSDAADE